MTAGSRATVVTLSGVVALLVHSCKEPEALCMRTDGNPLHGSQEIERLPGKDTEACPRDMVVVSGVMCKNVEQRCLRWLDKDQSPNANSGIGPLRCAEFAPVKCLDRPGEGVPVNVCMDRYEWPNQPDEFPVIDIDWVHAAAQCSSVSKRLCTAQEWTFACEGPDSKPYPYGDGLHRDAEACNIDEPSMDPTLPRTEWPKHNRSVPSGVMARCVSWAGVHDMTGNVDEWVFNPDGFYDRQPFVSGLRGGYWGPVRNRCRPMTDVHGPGFRFYQIGFRCCKDVLP